MKNSINKVEISGFLGRDPQVKSFKSGRTMVSLCLGSMRFYKDKGGNWANNVVWHNVVLWKELNAALRDQLRKGSGVHVDGRLESRMYTAHDGQRRYITQIVASKISLAGR